MFHKIKTVTFYKTFYIFFFFLFSGYRVTNLTSKPTYSLDKAHISSEHFIHAN